MTDESVRNVATRLELLGSQRRLLLLSTLRERAASMSVRELATAIAYREDGVDEVTQERIDHVRSSLYHRHLPKLDSAGIVDFDDEADRVELADGMGDVESILDAVLD